MTNDPKKDVDACIDLIYAVVKGHFLACACELFGASSLDEALILPLGIHTAPKQQQLAFIYKMARMVVDRCSLIESAFTSETAPDPTAGVSTTMGRVATAATRAATPIDGKYNYARVLCHYGSLVMEFRDGWAEGDGERVLRCWKLFLPHFKAAGRTKYSLEALRVQMQANITLSPNLAHQVKWNRFVNEKGGAGKNIPFDLYNEHVNKKLQQTSQSMGPNLTEKAIQRAARSITTLHNICDKFDKETAVPFRTIAHSTRPDKEDIKKVVDVVLKNKLLVKMSARSHRSFPGIALNPLHKFDSNKTIKWVKAKIKEYQKYKGNFRDECEIEIETACDDLHLDSMAEIPF